MVSTHGICAARRYSCASRPIADQQIELVGRREGRPLSGSSQTWPAYHCVEGRRYFGPDGARYRQRRGGAAMSWQATAWAVRQKTGSAGCKLLLLTLANYADDTGCCWPGQDTLKNDTEQSLDTIQRQLKKLETLGLVRKVPRPMGPGRWSSRTYFLNMTAAA